MWSCDPCTYCDYPSGRDGRFGSKVSQIGPNWDKSGTFFRSDFSTFWLAEPKCTEVWSEKSPGFVSFGANLTLPKCTEIWFEKKSPGFVPFGANLILFGSKSDNTKTYPLCLDCKYRGLDLPSFICFLVDSFFYMISFIVYLLLWVDLLLFSTFELKR